VHIADFSLGPRTSATVYTLAVAQHHEPFDSCAAPMDARLRRDSLDSSTKRSGIPIRPEVRRDAYPAPPSHRRRNRPGDTSVPCLPGAFDYSLNGRGWYTRVTRQSTCDGGIPQGALMAARTGPCGPWTSRA